MTQAFDKDFWESHWQEAKGRAPGREIVPSPYLVREVSSLAPGTAPDAGCGEGAEAIWLLDVGRRWHGWRAASSNSNSRTPGSDIWTCSHGSTATPGDGLRHRVRRGVREDQAAVFKWSLIHTPGEGLR
jgi:hypothetical protein